MVRVFLGGTCNESKWRDLMKDTPHIKFFNPVVKDWTIEAQGIELKERETSDFVLYVITPKMTGVYSIAEVVDDSNKRPEKTIFVTLPIDGPSIFTKAQAKSLHAVGEMLIKNGAHVFANLHDVLLFLNQK